MEDEWLNGYLISGVLMVNHGIFDWDFWRFRLRKVSNGVRGFPKTSTSQVVHGGFTGRVPWKIHHTLWFLHTKTMENRHFELVNQL